MITQKFKSSLSQAVSPFFALAMVASASAADPPSEASPLKKEKLQIVFLMGQSNMVGLADIGTSWYLTQPQYVPPRDLMLKKSETFDWNNLYWQGVRYYKGPPELEKQIADLAEERGTSRAMWRNRTKGEWKAEWGAKPEKGRDAIYEMLDRKAEEEGIYTRMAKILDGPENQFPTEKAYQEIISRDQYNAEHIERVREIYLNGTQEKDFEPFLTELTKAKKRKDSPETPEEVRTRIAMIGEQTVKLPIAKRTHIFSHGAFESSDAPSNTLATGHGPLSIGWGAKVTTIGPEYGVGITLERLVDAPILLVKCAWGNTAVREAWRPASLDGIETPAEKSQREAWNAIETANAKEEGREPKLRQPPTKTGKLSWAWNMALPAVQKVLADPGAYHSEYDPEKGYEIAGMVWFQGYSDIGNQAYGEQLEEMIKWFRKEINAPNMPVVCGTVGVGAYEHIAYTGEVNGGMVQAARSPELKGTVDVVNTARYFPHELAALITALNATEKDSPEFSKLRALHVKINSSQGFHYFGSAKFFMLTGDAMARSLANLMSGGEPAILSDPKATK